MEVSTYITGHQTLPIGFLHITWMTEMLADFGYPEDYTLVRKEIA